MKKLLGAVTAVFVGSMMMLSGCGSYTAYDYDLSEYVKVGQYEGLTYKKPEQIKISKKELNAAIKEDLEAAKKLEDVKDGKVHNGDTANIDYEGTIDGKAFDGGSAEGYDLIIGSNSFIDGFEKGLIGEKVGDKVSLDLKFPKDYGNADVAGKKVTFDVTINSSKTYVVPTEEEFVKDSKEYKSVKAYEKAKKESLKQAAEDQQQSEIKQQLWNQVVEKSELIKTPEKEVNEYIEKLKKTVTDYAEQNEMEYAQVLKNYYGVDEETFEKQLKETAENNAYDQMLVYAIAREEKIDVDKKEYDKFIEDQLKATGYDEKEFEEYTGVTYEEYVGGESEIYYYLYYQKVIDLIEKAAKQK